MKDKVVVAAAQIDVALFDIGANLATIERCTRQAKEEQNVDLIVFPELSSIGYIRQRDKVFGLEYIKGAQTVEGEFVQGLCEIAKKYCVHIISGMTEAHADIPGLMYNAAVCISPEGKVLGKHQKVHMPGYEKHYFAPANTTDVIHTDLGTIAIGICYDNQFPELIRTFALKGAEMCVMLWNMPTFSNEPEMLQRLTSTRAFENRFAVVSCNRYGEQGGIEFLGHSAIADPLGNLIAKAGDGEAMLYATLNRDDMLRERAQMPIFRDRRPDLYSELIKPL